MSSSTTTCMQGRPGAPRAGRFTDEEEDSGADSMNDVMSSKSSHSCRWGDIPRRLHLPHLVTPCHHLSHLVTPCTPCHRSWASPMQQHLSIVPYQGHGSGRPHGCGYCSGDCCAPFYPSHCSQQSLQVALPMPSNIEERLRALEGDKDQLHIQVLIISKNCI